MRTENRTVVVLPPPLSGYQQIENYAGDMAGALLTKLDEFDSIWALTNSICDRYLEPVAA
jgi:hypothetical protein